MFNIFFFYIIIDQNVVEIRKAKYIEIFAQNIVNKSLKNV